MSRRDCRYSGAVAQVRDRWTWLFSCQRIFPVLVWLGDGIYSVPLTQ